VRMFIRPCNINHIRMWTAQEWIWVNSFEPQERSGTEKQITLSSSILLVLSRSVSLQV
jgi:serine kinase of HPr protein (carbohydrate metabolism regulator)